MLKEHESYEENFECLKKTGCLMIKKNSEEIKEEENKDLKDQSFDNNIKKLLNCELKLKLNYYKANESINFMIEDIIKQYGENPIKSACGEINGNKVYALIIDNKIVSPIGWIEKETGNISDKIDYELIDFRKIKIEK